MLQKLHWRAARTIAAGAAVALGMCTAAVGQQAPRVASDEPAGFLVFPKVIVDTSAQFTGGPAIDTLIQITNLDRDGMNASGTGNPGDPIVGDGSHYLNCWYVNANSFCSNDLPNGGSGTQCRSNADCTAPGVCQPLWRVQDFSLLLTPGQPVAWRVSEGATFLPCDAASPDVGSCAFNNTGNVPLTEDPFQGELKCVEVDGNDEPIPANDFKGEATILAVDTGDGGLVDAASYNAIGIQSGDLTDPANVLCLGGESADPTADCPSPEYAGCPGVLVLDHFFEGAVSPSTGNVITTDLTLVPCSENFEGGVGTDLIENQVSVTAQMLVYNEFEQRFSTSRSVECYADIGLSDIDTRPGPGDDIYSIFSAGVQGTLAGQTRVRGVESASADDGRGLLGVAQEFQRAPNGTSPRELEILGSAAYNLKYSGSRAQRDVVRLSVP